jgi:uncharacterized protein
MDAEKVVQDAYAAFAAGDLPVFLGLLDPQVEWFEAEHSVYWTGDPCIGPEQVVEQVLVPIQQDFDGFRIDISRMVADGSTVLVEARYAGTARSTGQPLDAEVAHVWDVRDGRVVRFRQYVDTLRLAEVTGRLQGA